MQKTAQRFQPYQNAVKADLVFQQLNFPGKSMLTLNFNDGF
ncbi:MAG: hypothetical protein ACYC2P_11140 [Paludibacteraceae bacterium]